MDESIIKDFGLRLFEVEDWYSYTQSERSSWHDRYCKVLDEVRNMRHKLEAGERLAPLENCEHKKFLDDLLLNSNNGIASIKNWGKISHIQFGIFIKNEKILTCIENLIKTPSAKNSQALSDAIYNCNDKHKGEKGFKKDARYQHAVVNRVAAACNSELCSTVFYKIFNYAFEDLIKLKVIDSYNGEVRVKGDKKTQATEWYNKNEYMMNKLRKKFKNDIAEGTIDLIWLNIFVWYRGKKLDAEAEERKRKAKALKKRIATIQ